MCECDRERVRETEREEGERGGGQGWGKMVTSTREVKSTIFLSFTLNSRENVFRVFVAFQPTLTS